MCKINNIDDIKSWRDIEKHIRYFYDNPKDDFIILQKIDSNYMLLSENDVNNINTNHYKCYLFPYYCLRDIGLYTSEKTFRGFNAMPYYQIISYLYTYRYDTSIYKLLWFTGALYHIIENYHYYWFSNCINYDETYIKNILKHMLKICGNEINIKLNILNYRYIFGAARKNFLPIESLDYNYEFINKSLNISDVNTIIDYINLIIQEIKTNYRFVVIYDSDID